MKLESKFTMKYESMLSSKFSVLYQARYCAQEDISLVVCKDGIIKMLDYPFSFTNFTNSKPVCFLLKTDRDSKLVVSGSKLYVSGKSTQKSSFVKFSESSKSLNVLPSMLDERSGFCVCSFMQKIIVIGGHINYKSINSCMAYDIKTNQWNYIASMNESRDNASCTVFNGKLVVTGGYDSRAFNSFLKSVEAFCFHENKWTQLPDMLQRKSGHSTVSLGNKMFLIARYFSDSCEVYDSLTSKFTLLKRPYEKYINCYALNTTTIIVGYKIHVFMVKKVVKKYMVSTFCYDVIEKSWAFVDICDTECFEYFSCAKMFKH